MEESRTARVALGAVVAALTAVATYALGIQGTYGFYHLGDGVYWAAALAFGPGIGAAAGALGGALADVLKGFAVPWAPITLVVKGLAGWAVGAAGRRASGVGGRLLAVVPGALVTVAGYGLSAYLLYGPAGALQELYFDLGQVSAGALIAVVLAPWLKRAWGAAGRSRPPVPPVR